MKHKQRRATAPGSPDAAASGLQGSLVFYGPNDSVATKAVGAVFVMPQRESLARQLWYSAGDDLRSDPALAAQIAQFFKEQGAWRVTVGERIVGCPHEEGVDFAVGTSCPLCPYWSKPKA